MPGSGLEILARALAPGQISEGVVGPTEVLSSVLGLGGTGGEAGTPCGNVVRRIVSGNDPGVLIIHFQLFATLRDPAGIRSRVH